MYVVGVGEKRGIIYYLINNCISRERERLKRERGIVVVVVVIQIVMKEEKNRNVCLDDG